MQRCFPGTGEVVYGFTGELPDDFNTEFIGAVVNLNGCHTSSFYIPMDRESGSQDT